MMPVERDDCISAYHRTMVESGSRRLSGFWALEEWNYAKADCRTWRPVDRDEALSFQGSADLYALGLYVLGRNDTAATSRRCIPWMCNAPVCDEEWAFLISGIS